MFELYVRTYDDGFLYNSLGVIYVDCVYRWLFRCDWNALLEKKRKKEYKCIIILIHMCVPINYSENWEIKKKLKEFFFYPKSNIFPLFISSPDSKILKNKSHPKVIFPLILLCFIKYVSRRMFFSLITPRWIKMYILI